jgi:cytochrome c-type biogenesis protein CcmH/NrfG
MQVRRNNKAGTDEIRSFFFWPFGRESDTASLPEVASVRSISPYWVGGAIVAVILLGWTVAVATGHWSTQVSPDMVRMFLRRG